jgi:hypothetical protein
MKHMSLTTIALLGIATLVVLLLLGMDIGLSMLAVGFVGVLLVTTPSAALAFLG